MKCSPPLNPNKTKSRLLGATSSLRDMTEKSCSKIKDSMPKDVYVFNVMAVGDIKLASADLFDVQS